MANISKCTGTDVRLCVCELWVCAPAKEFGPKQKEVKKQKKMW